MNTQIAEPIQECPDFDLIDPHWSPRTSMHDPDAMAELLEMLEKYRTTEEAQEDLFDSAGKFRAGQGHKEMLAVYSAQKALLLDQLSAAARGLLEAHRSVSIPGAIFSYIPGENGETEFDQLCGRPCLTLGK